MGFNEKRTTKYGLPAVIALCATLSLGYVGGAQANCSCFCVDGTSRTVCDDIGDAQGGATKCQLSVDRRTECPVLDGDQTVVEEGIPVGATNCIRTRIYDLKTNTYSEEVNICNVIPIG